MESKTGSAPIQPLMVNKDAASGKMERESPGSTSSDDLSIELFNKI